MADSKSDEILMPNYLIDIGFFLYRSTYFDENVTSLAGFDELAASLIVYCNESFSSCVSMVMFYLLPHKD